MLADQLDYVVGVDPHRDSHALAVVHVRSGGVVFESTVIANSGGYGQALKLVEMHAPGRRAFAVEGAGSFGAGLTRFLTGFARARIPDAAVTRKESTRGPCFRDSSLWLLKTSAVGPISRVRGTCRGTQGCRSPGGSERLDRSQVSRAKWRRFRHLPLE